MPKKNKISDKILKNQKKEIDFTSFRPQEVIPQRVNTIIAFTIFLFSLIMYMITKAETTSFWDAGEYIAVSSFFGIAHPPGNPFYVILGRFATIFNFGFEHALVINFLSALFSAFAVMFTYLITVQLLSMWNHNVKGGGEVLTSLEVFAGGFFASIMIAFSFTFWMNAIEAEVYAGLAFFINIIVWLTFIWLKKQNDFSHQNLLLLVIYIFFLGFGVHQTTLQIAPAILFIVVLPFIFDSMKTVQFWVKIACFMFALLMVYIGADKIGDNFSIPEFEKFAVGAAVIVILWWYLREYVEERTWGIGILLMLIGFSTHLFLLTRSEFRPFINQGHPHDFDLFMDYILRRQYQAADASFLNRRAGWFYQFDFHFLRYFSWQFLDVQVVADWFKAPVNFIRFLSNMIVLLLGINGFYFAFKRNKNAFWYLLSLFFMTSIAMIVVMNLSNEEVRDRDYFFVTAYNFWAVAMGLGVVGIVSVLKRSFAKYIMIGLILIYPMFNLASQYNKHDRTGEFIALDYGLNILNSLEENAIIFTNGDNDTFPPWYVQSVKDRHAFEHIYPARDVFPTARTEQLLSDAIQWKNSHINGLRQDVTVANLSLMNTPWYLKQLRDMEGVELNWTDEQIDSLVPRRFATDTEVAVNPPNANDRFTIVIPALSPLRVKDFAVIQVVRDNFGKRPMYFASTCEDFTHLSEHLINEGMVYRIVSTKGTDRLDVQRLQNNLENVYSYRGIFNDKLYKDYNMVKLIGNYCASFMRLGDHFRRLGDYENAVKFTERGLEFILDPKERVRFVGNMCYLYGEAGEVDKVNDFLLPLIAENPTFVNYYIIGAASMFRAEEFTQGFDYIEKGFLVDNNNRYLISLLIQTGVESNQRARAIQIIRDHMEAIDIKSAIIEMIADTTLTLDDF